MKGLQSITCHGFLSSLTHGNKSAAFTAVSCGSALIFKDAESLVQSHRCLLWKGMLTQQVSAWMQTLFSTIQKHKAANTNWFPNTVNVKLQRHAFWYFLLHRFHFDRSRAGSWGMQGPSSGRPTRKSQKQTFFVSARRPVCEVWC